jgi:hypothetical protein
MRRSAVRFREWANFTILFGFLLKPVEIVYFLEMMRGESGAGKLCILHSTFFLHFAGASRIRLQFFLLSCYLPRGANAYTPNPLSAS